MMPQVVTVHVHHGQKRSIRLWIPLLPVFVVLSPLLLVAAFILVVTCVVYRISPGPAFGAIWHLLSALRGFNLEVQQGRHGVLVNIT